MLSIASRKRIIACLAVGFAFMSCTGQKTAPDLKSDAVVDTSQQSDVRGLALPSSFLHISNTKNRSMALFQEVGKVIQHPRCVNCHAMGDRPLQGDDGALHQPLVDRGESGLGAPGLRCNSCHGPESFQNVPGNDPWKLAPRSMTWEGRSLGEICEQIKDKDRNGGKSLNQLIEHMAHDSLVAYGWRAPAHLSTPPGDQPTLGSLFKAWVESGAHCPSP